MTRQTLSSGSRFEQLAGYSRAVIDDDWILLSGTAGYDFANDTISDDAAEQARQCLATISETLTKAGASLGDVVRVRVFLASRDDVVAVSKVLADTFHDPQPASTMIICGFFMPEMKVEIEVTARRLA